VYNIKWGGFMENLPDGLVQLIDRFKEHLE